MYGMLNPVFVFLYVSIVTFLWLILRTSWKSQALFREEVGVAASVVLLHHKTQAILFLSDYNLNAKTHFWRLLPGT